jgi:hypothetical protein
LPGLVHRVPGIEQRGHSLRRPAALDGEDPQAPRRIEHRRNPALPFGNANLHAGRNSKNPAENAFLKKFKQLQKVEKKLSDGITPKNLHIAIFIVFDSCDVQY